MLPLILIEVREYLDQGGCSPFAAWSDRLNREAAAKVAAALARIQQGNLSNAKSVGAGVHEDRIEFGPGYRTYYGKDGERLVIIVGGGTKNVNRRISILRRPDGETINCEKGRGSDHYGFDTRFQGNNPGAREA